MKRISPRTCCELFSDANVVVQNWLLLTVKNALVVWPVTFTLIITFVLSIGLTYRSDHHCYAGTCGSTLFPLQARLHVVLWYLWISISLIFLGIRTFSPKLRHVLRTRLTQRKVPILGKRFCLSSVLVVAWICILYGALVANWWIRLKDYFVERGIEGGVFSGNKRLAAIALTGHVCDVTMGMVMLPISRHSALASFFRLSVSTTLTFHMLTAYTLFTLVTIHGLLYVSWLPVFSSLSSTLQKVYPVLNPTYLYSDTWPGNTSSLGIWRASLVFTGLFSTVIMVVIFITTLPSIRRRHFNFFYFTHLSVILAVIVICLHASTMFYCTSPGLILWLVDWSLRLYELSRGIDANVTTLSNRYHLLTMKVPRKRLSGCACTSPLAHFYIYHADSSRRELHPFTTITSMASEKCKNVEDKDITVQFLFRKQGNTRKNKVPDPATLLQDAANETLTKVDPSFLSRLRRLVVIPKKQNKLQWTEKLATYHGKVVYADIEAPAASRESSKDSSKNPSKNPSVSDLAIRARESASESLGEGHTHPLIDVRLRLEGPYFTPADPYRYRTVICLVAGTGISGGIAIAGAFAEAERIRQCSAPQSTDSVDSVDSVDKLPVCQAVAKESPWNRCVLVWSVREEDYMEIPPLKSLQNRTPRLEVETQLTGNGRPRVDFAATLNSILYPSRPTTSSSSISEDSEGSFLPTPIFGAPFFSDADLDGNIGTTLPQNETDVAITETSTTIETSTMPGPSTSATPAPSLREFDPSSCWVYLSGPNAFITAGEAVCAEMGLDYYGARWEI